MADILVAKARHVNTEHVFVIAGDDPSLVNAKYTEIIDQLIPPEERDMGLLVVDADKAIIGEILDELRTLPFFTKKRIVALRNADKFISAHGEEDEQDEQDKKASSPEPPIAKFSKNTSTTPALQAFW